MTGYVDEDLGQHRFRWLPETTRNLLWIGPLGTIVNEICIKIHAFSFYAWNAFEHVVWKTPAIVIEIPQSLLEVKTLFIRPTEPPFTEWSLQRRHNERDGVSNHRGIHCLLTCWLQRRSKKTSKPRVTGICVGNSPVTGEFPAQRASNAENVSIWWRHHDMA